MDTRKRLQLLRESLAAIDADAILRFDEKVEEKDSKIIEGRLILNHRRQANP